MSTQEELEAQLLEAQIAVGEWKNQAEIAEQHVKDAKVTVNGYVDEIRRVAEATKNMLQNVAQIQAAGDRVRVRLGKAQKALMAADAYVAVLLKERSNRPSISYEFEAARDAYAASKEMLKTVDTP